MAKPTKTIAAALALSCAAFTSPAQAGTSDGIMLVGATVLEACTIVAGPMAFGDISLSGSDIDTTATLTLACTPNADYDILMNNGAFPDSGQRRMANLLEDEFLEYEIYLDASRTQRWGNTIGADTVAGSANALGVATHTAYGRISGLASSATAAVYADTVTVTVDF